MQKQTILITGASSGIGYEIAKLAAERGHTVIGTAPNAELLANIPGGTSLKLVIDICNQPSIDKALNDIKDAGMTISCLINNAGFAQPGPIELVDDALLRKQFEVNVFGTLAMTRSALPDLRNLASEGKRARIITLSSMLGRIAFPLQGIYAASKHALEGAFDALRMELIGTGVEVSLIEPGFINTQFTQLSRSLVPDQWLQHKLYGPKLKEYIELSAEAETDNPQGKAKIAAKMAGSAEEVAATVIRAIESDKIKARYPVTAMAKIMPFLSIILPSKTWDRIQTS